MHKDLEKVYNGLTRSDIEAQYMLRNTRPNYEEKDIPRWLEKSELFRAKTNGRLDLTYGPRPRNKLDFFAPKGLPVGLVLYIHGGYWQRGDKSVYSFVAEPFVNRGYSVAVMNYQMCPDVRLIEIAPQARNAIKWLWRNAEELGIMRNNFNIMGHSAGGHLTAEMLFTDWTCESDDLPRDLLHAAVAVSGIYDFEPILFCSENEGLRMDDAEAKAASMTYRQPSVDVPHIVAYGLNEPTDMHRQSHSYAKTFEDDFSSLEIIAIDGADHFETIDIMIDEDSEIFNSTCALFED